MQKEVAVVDIETTGLSSNYHKITEIAAVRLNDGKEFCSLVNPECHIPGFITRLTGIDDRMVKDAPTIEEVLPAFLRFMGNNHFIAHNASFDYNFINHNSKMHLQKPFINPKICTRRIANRLLPFLPSKKLNTICSYFEIKNQNEHRALGDARATAEIFERFLQMVNKDDTEDAFTRIERMLNKNTLPRLS